MHAETQTPRWIAMVVALMDDLAAQLTQADGQAVGTAEQAGTPKPTSAAGTHGALIWGVLAGRVAPAAPPSPASDAAPAEVPATVRALLEELGAARLAVDAADTLAVAQRVGDAQDVAHALAAYEQASLTYHLTAGRRPAGEAGGGAEPRAASRGVPGWMPGWPWRRRPRRSRLRSGRRRSLATWCPSGRER